MKKLKALIVIRLSRQVEESTSAERQLEECTRLCEQMGWEVVGVAEDLNVSAGATTPFQRPQLRQWIGDGKEDPGRSHEIDALVFWRLDRLVRSMVQLSEVMNWADKHGIILKSATEPHFDMSTAFGKIIASLVASFAEMELEAIRERITADQHHRIRAGNFRGAVPPWGYRAVDDPERGKILEPDPEQVRQINWVVSQVLEGKPTQRIADELNKAGELTSRDRHNVLMGREPQGFQWVGGKIKELLTSKTLLGYIVTRDAVLGENGRPKKDAKGRTIYGQPYVVINDDGTPKVRAEPILSREMFERVGGELKSRENQSHVTKRSTSLLLGVLHCGYCGNVAYRMRGSKGRKLQYRCRTKQDRGECSAPVATVELEWIDDLVENYMLTMMKGSQRRTRKWNEGEDYSGEVVELEARLKDLIPLLGTGVFRSGSTQYDMLQDQIAKVSERLETLKSLGDQPGQWVWEETGEKFSDWWNSATVQEKNIYLKQAGLRVEYRHRLPRKRGDRPHIHFIVEDLGAFSRDYEASEAVRRYQEIMSKVPAGHNLEYENGEWMLKERQRPL